EIAANIANPAQRSCAVTTLATGPGDAGRLREWTEREAGVTLGIGLGFGQPGSEAFRSHFRIGHMGHLNIPMLLGTLGAIDAGLKSLNIPNGSGALEAASESLAQALR
ncbi:MAG: alanine--glyoxylate aminotransferase family protein, partial [Pseudomonadota bacterium]